MLPQEGQSQSSNTSPEQHVSENAPNGTNRSIKEDDASSSQLKIFVGGLPQEATSEVLEGYFAKYGSILNCVVKRDSETRRSRGFGFVAFDNDQAVEDVLAAPRHVICEKQVECKRALPRSSQPGGVGASVVGSTGSGHGTVAYAEYAPNDPTAYYERGRVPRPAAPIAYYQMPAGPRRPHSKGNGAPPVSYGAYGVGTGGAVGGWSRQGTSSEVHHHPCGDEYSTATGVHGAGKVGSERGAAMHSLIYKEVHSVSYGGQPQAGGRNGGRYFGGGGGRVLSGGYGSGAAGTYGYGMPYGVPAPAGAIAGEGGGGDENCGSGVASALGESSSMIAASSANATSSFAPTARVADYGTTARGRGRSLRVAPY